MPALFLIDLCEEALLIDCLPEEEEEAFGFDPWEFDLCLEEMAVGTFSSSISLS